MEDQVDPMDSTPAGEFDLIPAACFLNMEDHLSSAFQTCRIGAHTFPLGRRWKINFPVDQLTLCKVKLGLKPCFCGAADELEDQAETEEFRGRGEEFHHWCSA